jgi:dTDP-glucose pyrophosphorylase
MILAFPRDGLILSLQKPAKTSMKPSLLILAAGMGSRYGGLKQIDGVGPQGEILLEYSIYDAIQAGFGKIVFVIRPDLEVAFMEKIGQKLQAQQVPFEFVYQEIDTPIPGINAFPDREKPWGTGHAILVAKDAIQEPFAVINADDYYGADGFRSLVQFLQNECSPDHYAMVGYVLANTLSENGFVSRGVCETDTEYRLLSVTERTKIQRNDSGVIEYEADAEKTTLPDTTYVSMNFWGFHPNVFEALQRDFVAFVQHNWGHPKAEFYIPTAVNDLMQAGKIQVSLLPSQELWYGVTYKEDRETVARAFQEFIAAGKYPTALWSASKA